MQICKQEQIFRQWIEAHMGVMLKVVRVNASGPEDQNDLFQEIARQVWLSIPSFQEKSKVSTWIYRVALNSSLVWHRRRKKHRHVQVDLDLAIERSDSVEDPSQAMEHRERLEWLYKEIRKLPKLDRSLVVLYLDENSYRDIADNCMLHTSGCPDRPAGRFTGTHPALETGPGRGDRLPDHSDH